MLKNISMNVTHLQSSTQLIEIGGKVVLTDPWLTDGEYYGSWYHYPPFDNLMISELKYDYIYVSHIHPDHISDRTFNMLPLKVPVLIHSYASKFLKHKIMKLGFDVIECQHGKPFHLTPNAKVTIYAADNCDPELCGRFFGCNSLESEYGSSQIDSFAIYEHDGYVIVNTNDCPFELAVKTILSNKIHEIDIDFLLVGYAGAGAYPQCFENLSNTEKLQEAELKKITFLDKARRYIELLKPKSFAPFAGTYILGSKLTELNDLRGVPDVDDAVSYLQEHITCSSRGLSMKQFDKYEIMQRELLKVDQNYHLSQKEYISEIATNELSYDFDNWDDNELPQLFANAYKRFLAKANEINCDSKTKIILETKNLYFIFGISCDPNVSYEPMVIDGDYIKIKLDHNLLHRLLRGPQFAHWNNAEIGSHLLFYRKPNSYERALHHCLCYFHQ